MTLGYWVDQARTALESAAAALDGQAPGGSNEILAVVGAREDIYSGLMRLTELLVGGRPTRQHESRAAAEVVLGRGGQHLTRLYVGLHAALVEQRYPPAPTPASPVSAGLRRAADAIGVTGDILASHVPPGARPRTPEGSAILVGGGVQAALADVARLAHGIVGVDARLPTWLAQGGSLYAGTYGPVTEAARWASQSLLRVVARELITAGRDHPPLLRLLGNAPVLPNSSSSVDSRDVVAAVATARDWLWRNPDQIHAAHLQAATQLGLAIHTLAAADTSGPLRAWRQAAIATADLRGSPPVGEARLVHVELAEALRWTHQELHLHQQGKLGHGVADVSRLVDAMPVLTVALHRAVPLAVKRGELFVRAETVLQKPPTGLLYYATTTWRPATGNDNRVRKLANALDRLRPGNTVDALQALPTSASVARLAFPVPTQPRSEPTISHSPHTSPPTSERGEFRGR